MVNIYKTDNIHKHAIKKNLALQERKPGKRTVAGLSLRFGTQDNIEELVQHVRFSKDRGGIILVGVSGPVAKKALNEEFKSRLSETIELKYVQWKPGLKDLREIFPLEDSPDTLYIVDGMEEDAAAGEERERAVLALINMTREFYGQNKKIVIYRIPPDFLFKKIQFKAADFWSFRTATFNFFEPEDHAAEVREKVDTEMEFYITPAEQIAHTKELLDKERKEKKSNKKRIAVLLENLGKYNYDVGNIEESLKCLKKALKLHREQGDKRAEAFTRSHIGHAYLRLRDLENASIYQNETLLLAQELKDRSIEALAYNYIGRTYLSNSNLDEALKYLNEALEINTMLANKRNKAIDLTYIGVVHLEKGYLEKAINNISESFEMARPLGDEKGVAINLKYFGKIYQKKGDLEASIKCYQEALEIFEKIGDKHNISETEQLLKELKDQLSPSNVS